MPVILLGRTGTTTSFQADTNFDGVIDIDFSDRPLTRAPEIMYTLQANYAHDWGSIGGLDWNLRVSYEDESVQGYSSIGPEFNATLNDRTIVDASVTFTDSSDRYWVKLFAQNLTDERYRTGQLSVANLWVMSAYGPPRWIGIELGANFGW